MLQIQKICAPTSRTLSISAETKHIFATVGVDRMIITPGGSVSFGTCQNPGFVFQINSDVNITSSNLNDGISPFL